MLPFVLIAILVMVLLGLWANARYSARRAVPTPPAVESETPLQPLTLTAGAESSASDAKSDTTRLRELQAQIRTRDSVIKRLMGSADETDAQMAQQQDELSRHGEMIDQQVDLLREREQRIEQLEPLVRTSQEEIGDMRSQLQRAGQLIQVVAAREQKIAQLKNRISHLDALSLVLNDRIGVLAPNPERINRLQQEIDTRNAIIAQLETDARQSVSQFEAMLADKDDRISKLDTAVRQVSLLEAALSEKDETITGLKKIVGELEHSVSQHEGKLKHLEETEQNLSDARQKLALQTDHVAGLESEIRERDAQIESIQSSASNAAEQQVAREQFDELVDKLNHQERTSQGLQAELMQREQKYNQVQSQLLALAKVQETLEERENTIARQEQEIERLAEIERAQQEKDAELQELRAMSARLKASQAKASSIRTALTKAEQVAIAAQHGAAEAQRVREELHTLGRAHLGGNDSDGPQVNDAADSSVQPDVEIPLETAQQIQARIDDIERLEADTAERSKKISDLKKRLESLSRSRKKAGTIRRAPKTANTRKREIPAPLFEAPNERDDLKQIHGIGPVLEKTLNQIGVTTYRQLASFNEDDILRVTEALGIIPNRIERDDWVGGARKALAKSRGAH
jgi:predicted flap endonuclease-1-like 5' DNA nuclease